MSERKRLLLQAYNVILALIPEDDMHREMIQSWKQELHLHSTNASQVKMTRTRKPPSAVKRAERSQRREADSSWPDRPKRPCTVRQVLPTRIVHDGNPSQCMGTNNELYRCTPCAQSHCTSSPGKCSSTCCTPTGAHYSCQCPHWSHACDLEQDWISTRSDSGCGH